MILCPQINCKMSLRSFYAILLSTKLFFSNHSNGMLYVCMCLCLCVSVCICMCAFPVGFLWTWPYTNSLLIHSFTLPTKHLQVLCGRQDSKTPKTFSLIESIPTYTYLYNSQFPWLWWHLWIWGDITPLVILHYMAKEIL